MARLASARQPELNPIPPTVLAHEAIAMARRIGDPEVLLHTLHSAIGALVDYGRVAERAQLNREVVALAAAAGDRVRELRARTRLLFDWAQLGNPSEFEATLSGYEALLHEADQPRYGWVPLMFRSMRANWQGRFEEAAQLEAAARAMHERARGDGPPLVPARALGLGILRSDTDAIARAQGSIVSEYPTDLAFSILFQAFVEARRGQHREARAHIESSIDLERQPEFLEDVHMLEVLSEVAWHLRDAKLARQLAPKLNEHAGEAFLITGIGFSLHSVVDHARMRISFVLGDAAAVDRNARDALGFCARLGARPIAARVCCDWALALRELRGQAAKDQLALLLADALADAQTLGMTEVAARCRELLDSSTPASRLQQPFAADDAPLALALEGDYWSVGSAGEQCRVRDSRGMRMLAQLVQQPGRELHVFELSGVTQPVDGGDAGAVLDREAREAYERRLRELQAELEDAESANDIGRRERLQDEYEQLTAELSRAFGLGGRERRSGSVVERARVNVRRRLTLALQHIAKACPSLGRQLSADLQTGVYCAYRPKRV
jgi:hypothetical protein